MGDVVSQEVVFFPGKHFRLGLFGSQEQLFFNRPTEVLNARPQDVGCE